MSPRQLRYLALGDSYTIGEGVAEDERWPVQLATKLRTQGIPLENPEIIAKTGWTTDELAAGIDKARPRGPYDFVSLLIGVNDQYRGRCLDEYRQQFGDLLQRAIAFSAGDASRVLVVSIPDWSLTLIQRSQSRRNRARECGLRGHHPAIRNTGKDGCRRRPPPKRQSLHGVDQVGTADCSCDAAINR